MKPFKVTNPLAAKGKPHEMYNPTIHGVRQSMLECWMTCREKARLQIVQGWREKVASMPLVYGSLSHGVLKSVYRGLRDGHITDLESVYAGMDIFLAESEKELNKEDPMPSTFKKLMIEEACSILGKKLPFYFYQWWADDTSIEWSMVEDKFMVPIQMDDGQTVPLIGTFDATYRTTNKTLWLFETKNKSRWSDSIQTFMPLDLQVGIYITALRCLYSASPAGVRYNILRRPGERRKKEESLDDFSTRIQGNVARDPEHYFYRFEVQFTEEEKEEHVRRTEALVQEFYNWWRETQDHPDTRDLLWNSSACDGKYGVCKMLEACANKDYSFYKRESPARAAGIEEHE